MSSSGLIFFPDKGIIALDIVYSIAIPKIEKKLQMPDDVPANSGLKYPVVKEKLTLVNPLRVIPNITKTTNIGPNFIFSYKNAVNNKAIVATNKEKKQTHFLLWTTFTTIGKNKEPKMTPIEKDNNVTPCLESLYSFISLRKGPLHNPPISE